MVEMKKAKDDEAAMNHLWVEKSQEEAMEGLLQKRPAEHQEAPTWTTPRSSWNWLWWGYNCVTRGRIAKEKSTGRVWRRLKWQRWLKRLVSVQDEEISSVLGAFWGFFFLLGAYYMCLPLRDEAGMSLGTGSLPGLFVASLLATLVAAPLSSSLLTLPHISKGTALLRLYRFFAASLVVFFVLYCLCPSPAASKKGEEEEDGSGGVSMLFFLTRSSFFVWVALLNLLTLSAMWARLADVMSSEAGARLFGFIGAGGTFGQLAGSLASATFAPLGAGLLLVAAICMELAAQCALRISAMSAVTSAGTTACHVSSSRLMSAGTAESTLATASELAPESKSESKSRRSKSKESPATSPGSAHSSSPPGSKRKRKTDWTIHVGLTGDDTGGGATAGQCLVPKGGQTDELATGGTLRGLPGAECFPPHGAGGGGGKGGEGGGDLTGASNRGALSISPGEEFGAVGSRKGNARAGSASGDKLAEVRPSSFGGSLGGDGGGSGIQAAYVPDKPEMVLEATPGGPPRVHPLRNSLTLKSQLAVQAGVPAKVEAEPNKEKSHMAAPATTATCHDNGGGRSRGAGGSSNSAGARGTGGWRRQLADTCAVALEGMRMVAASPYLLHVCAFLLLSAVTSSFFYFQRAAVVAGAVADPVQRRVVIAHIHSMSAVATVALQLTLTGKLLTGAGVATALSASPLVAVLGMSAIALWPTPIVVATCEALRKVVTYVLTRPARELLFTVVSQEEKYKCKVAIDTLVQRLGDVAAAGVYRVLATWLMLGPSAVAACAIPVCAMWLVVGHTLGRRQQLLAKHSAAVHLN